MLPAYLEDEETTDPALAFQQFNLGYFYRIREEAKRRTEQLYDQKYADAPGITGDLAEYGETQAAPTPTPSPAVPRPAAAPVARPAAAVPRPVATPTPAVGKPPVPVAAPQAPAAPVARPVGPTAPTPTVPPRPAAPAVPSMATAPTPATPVAAKPPVRGPLAAPPGRRPPNA